MSNRAVSMFIPHGGGPMPLLNDPGHRAIIEFLTGKARTLLGLPKAIILVTAHWEEHVPTISSAENHSLLYDYSGFPREAYHVKYPAKGSPSVAEQVKLALNKQGFHAKLDNRRGWDHGVFVPLLLLVPDANIPIVQLSVLESQSAEEHIRMGRALSSLRDENIAIIGSGMSFHNLRAFFSQLPIDNNTPFEDAIQDACESIGLERDEKLLKWEKFNEARYAHPVGHAEHFMPLLVAAGAGGDSKGKNVARLPFMGAVVSAYLWS
ncbi:unnamed protein product [Didymodactylos carnosus]|uniref:Extradiol ring-cleavage dioxygenase class III enzyme subunit B domain-containing protein n=1 Tax=Didymodactylos carnosus TaxID=1234261 RepID=A0A814GHJ9_9BILA|nr:unnamed protein product [Didymodactylos carnosus]CAF0996431.1 unnamed protein product [Didymodactylos carnosus]CAF3689185.1 unnamed protein product [Didymodactylos carnosus]CAF3768044.1 unnamed protein product [Didymodactylos carnosus]